MCLYVVFAQVLPVSKSSQMVTFTFQNGIVATLRTSGTEPKIKYYTEFCAPPGKRYMSSRVSQNSFIHSNALNSLDLSYIFLPTLHYATLSFIILFLISDFIYII